MLGNPTKGPWMFDTKRGQVDCDGGTIANGIGWAANGFLISAAPELLSELAELVFRCQEWNVFLPDTLRPAIEAIEKARGNSSPPAIMEKP